MVKVSLLMKTVAATKVNLRTTTTMAKVDIVTMKLGIREILKKEN